MVGPQGLVATMGKGRLAWNEGEPNVTFGPVIVYQTLGVGH